MILTCPQCEIRYLLPATMLGEKGRRVKCSSCAKEWHQLPDIEEINEFQELDNSENISENHKEEEQEEYEQEEEKQEESSIDDIPDSVKPVLEKSSVPALQEDKPVSQGVLGGFIAAAAVFFIILAGLYFAYKPIVSAWPASRAFYQIMGKRSPVSGEGLVFDHLTVKVNSDGKMELIVIEGQIINLTAYEQIIPIIEAGLKDEQGIEIEKWNINLPDSKLGSEGVMKFSDTHKVNKNHAQNVHLSFVLKSEKFKKAEKIQKTEESQVSVSSEQH